MKATRTLVIGLGNLGKKLTADINTNNKGKFELICALDDDDSKSEYALSNGFREFSNTTDL